MKQTPETMPYEDSDIGTALKHTSIEPPKVSISKLSIIIPAYNEERFIHLILNKIKVLELVNGIKKEIIIAIILSIVGEVLAIVYTF